MCGRIWRWSWSHLGAVVVSGTGIRARRKLAAALLAGTVLLAVTSLQLLLHSPPDEPKPIIINETNVLPMMTGSLYVPGHAQPHPELCPALGAHTRLVILISSAPSNATAREAVRLTWGHAALRAGVVIAFVLGAPPPTLRPALHEEDELYKDLIEGRSVDSYHNLTLKTISMLEWLNVYCPHAQRLLKTDDDMFINVPRLLQFIDAPSRRNATNTIWGMLAEEAWPHRNSSSKYYIPLVQFPGDKYPPFTYGPAYLVTADAARRLLRAAGDERYIQLEDVFMTGVLAERLGIRRVHEPEFYNRYAFSHPSRCLTIHNVSYHMQFEIWRELLDVKNKSPRYYTQTPPAFRPLLAQGARQEGRE